MDINGALYIFTCINGFRRFVIVYHTFAIIPGSGYKSKNILRLHNVTQYDIHNELKYL